MTTIATTEEDNDTFLPSTAPFAGYKIGKDYWDWAVSFDNQQVYDAFLMDVPDGLDPYGNEFYKAVCHRFHSYDNEGAALTHLLATINEEESCLDFDNEKEALGYANATADQSADQGVFGGVFYWNTQINPFQKALECFVSMTNEHKEFATERTYEEQMKMHEEMMKLI